MYEHSIHSQKSLQSDLSDEFSVAIDHFIFYGMYETEGCLLAEKLGLRCAEDIISHSTQGTASQLIFFENAYLEVVHVSNEAIAAEYANRTGVNPILRRDWRESLVSPFGIALRLQSRPDSRFQPFTADGCAASQFESSIYFAPDNLKVEQEPLCFIIPGDVALSTLLDLSSSAHQSLVNHPSGARRVTSIELTIHSLSHLSKAIQMLAHRGLVKIKQGSSPLLEITLDGGLRNQIIDGRPDFPIVILQ